MLTKVVTEHGQNTIGTIAYDVDGERRYYHVDITCSRQQFIKHLMDGGNVGLNRKLMHEAELAARAANPNSKVRMRRINYKLAFRPYLGQWMKDRTLTPNKVAEHATV